MDRCQCRSAGPDLVGQRREAEIEAFLGVSLGLSVEGLVPPALGVARTGGASPLALEQNHRQKVRTRPSPRRGIEGRWRLADLFAGPARGFLSNGLITFHCRGSSRRSAAGGKPSAGRFEARTGEALRASRSPLLVNNGAQWLAVLAYHHDAVRAKAGARCRCLDHHPITRQVVRERLARRAAALEPGDRRGLRLPGVTLVLGGGGLELHLHLVDQAGTAFGAVAVVVAPELWRSRA